MENSQDAFFFKIEFLLSHVMAYINCLFLFYFYRTALETDLRIEKEWRATLQKTLEQEKTASAEVSTELQHLKHLEKVRLI